ncbi:hypothetical protein DERF_000243 [Dermatophagoides farinae]|uniref:Uncharacterized protein n=1 Tax=Dermatophagoides farinae TaxID=6954 RepID=A0A922LCC3_DERFA|nr:hypothetical protein DERF_000243 [Dermatophagoides farinae]
MQNNLPSSLSLCTPDIESYQKKNWCKHPQRKEKDEMIAKKKAIKTKHDHLIAKHEEQRSFVLIGHEQQQNKKKNTELEKKIPRF